MKISHKLILGFLLVALVSSVSTVFTLQSYRSIENTFAALIDHPTRMVEALNGLKYAGLEIVSTTDEYAFVHGEVANMSKEKQIEDEQQLTQEVREAFETSINRYDHLVNTVAEDDIESAHNIRHAGQNLLRTSTEIIAMKKRGLVGESVLKKREQFDVEERAYMTIIDAALRLESSEQIDEQKNVNASIALATTQALVVRGLTFGLAIFFGVYISFLISRRVHKLKAAILKVGSGELDAEIEIDSKDEIGDLARSFNQMTSDLTRSRVDLAAANVLTEKVLGSMVDFVVICDMDLTMTKVNNATLKLNGYEEHELIGKSVNMLMADRSFSQKGVDVLRKNGFVANLDKVNLNKDGSLTPISMSLSVFKDKDGDDLGIVCVGKDVTDRRRAETERAVISEIIQGVVSTKNLHELLQLIHESIGRVLDAENCFVALYDPKTEMLDMQFWVDKYDPAPPPFKMGRGFTAYVCRTGRAVLMTPKIIEQLFEQGEIELQGTAPVIWLGIPLKTSAGLIGMLAVQHYENKEAYGVRDLEFLASVGNQIALAIERKAAEERIRISEEQHRLLFETNPQPAFVYDLETLGFLSVNEAAVRHYGYSREEFFNDLTVKDIRPAENVPDFLARVSRITPQSDRLMAPSVHKTKNGTVIHVEITSQALLFNGRPAEIVLVSDVTERKRSEAERQVITEIIDGVNTTFNTKELLIHIHNSIRKIIYAENCFVVIHEHSTDQVTFEFWADLVDTMPQPSVISKSFTNHVLRTGKPLLLSEDLRNELYASGEVERIGSHSQSWLGVPLKTPERTIGVLVVQNYEIAGIYSQKDLEFLTTVADQIALAIERKQSDEALRISEEQHRLLFEKSPQPAFIFDLETLAFLAVNEAFVRHYGYTREELFSTVTTKDLRPSKNDKGAIDRLGRARSGEEIVLDPAKHRKKDGTIIDVEVTLHAVLFAGKRAEIVLVNDVTERKEGENRLATERNLLSTVIDTLPDFVFVKDINGRLLMDNSAHRSLLGVSSISEIIGKTDFDLFPRQFADQFFTDDQNVISTGESVIDVEEPIVDSEGNHRLLSTTKVPLRDLDGSIIGIVGVNRDITMRKRAEEQLKIYNAKLKQSNRELQDFAYVASHDLQEPLRKVQAFSDRLKTKYADKLEGDGLDYLERMRSAANRMQLLIQDLLTFSRVSTKAQPFVPVDLETITREVLSDLEVKIEETGAIIEFLDLPVIDADPMQMRQLLQNLIGNALKFRQKDTTPFIGIHAIRVAPNGNGGSGYCQLFVKDNGIGFDEKYSDKIFAVFQRLHGRVEYEGSGVGLAICRKIAERHDGTITAQSAPGRGSTFIVTLPVKQLKADVTE